MSMNGPAVYVGTYHKYNCGSIKGAWLELENFADHDDFMKAATELHKDEADPELMFQDFQCFPRAFYGESHIKPELWDWLELDEEDRELLAVYQDNIDSDADIERAREAFQGKHDSERAWAEDWLEQTDGLEGVPDHLQHYIDFEAYARDARMGGDVSFIRHDGDVWVFSNH